MFVLVYVLFIILSSMANALTHDYSALLLAAQAIDSYCFGFIPRASFNNCSRVRSPCNGLAQCKLLEVKSSKSLFESGSHSDVT